MRTAPVGSMVFTEDTNIRKRRTVVLIPSDESGVYFVGWAECGPEDVFSRAEGIKQALKRANKAKHHSIQGLDLPQRTGRLKVTSPYAASDRSKFVDDVEDILYNQKILRSNNEIDVNDILRLIKFARDTRKSATSLHEELVWVTEGLDHIPAKIINLGVALENVLQELEKWKRLQPKTKEAE